VGEINYIRLPTYLLDSNCINQLEFVLRVSKHPEDRNKLKRNFPKEPEGSFFMIGGDRNGS